MSNWLAGAGTASSSGSIISSRCKYSRPGFRTTLEIGAGLGEHLDYERLTPDQEAWYYANEFRPNMAAEIERRHPRVKVVPGDCQQPLPFADGFFDRAIAVHVLEHLPNLPAAIREIYRLLHRERGQFLVVIPCEGSPAYSWRAAFRPSASSSARTDALRSDHQAGAHQSALGDSGGTRPVFRRPTQTVVSAAVPAIRHAQPGHGTGAHAAADALGSAPRHSSEGRRS